MSPTFRSPADFTVIGSVFSVTVVAVLSERLQFAATIIVLSAAASLFAVTNPVCVIVALPDFMLHTIVSLEVLGVFTAFNCNVPPGVISAVAPVSLNDIVKPVA